MFVCLYITISPPPRKPCNYITRRLKGLVCFVYLCCCSSPSSPINKLKDNWASGERKSCPVSLISLLCGSIHLFNCMVVGIGRSVAAVCCFFAWVISLYIGVIVYRVC